MKQNLRYPTEQIVLDYINSQNIKVLLGVKTKDMVKMITSPEKIESWTSAHFYKVMFAIDNTIDTLNNNRHNGIK